MVTFVNDTVVGGMEGDGDERMAGVVISGGDGDLRRTCPCATAEGATDQWRDW